MSGFPGMLPGGFDAAFLCPLEVPADPWLEEGTRPLLETLPTLCKLALLCSINGLNGVVACVVLSDSLETLLTIFCAWPWPLPLPLPLLLLITFSPLTLFFSSFRVATWFPNVGWLNALLDCLTT